MRTKMRPFDRLYRPITDPNGIVDGTHLFTSDGGCCHVSFVKTDAAGRLTVRVHWCATETTHHHEGDWLLSYDAGLGQWTMAREMRLVDAGFGAMTLSLTDPKAIYEGMRLTLATETSLHQADVVLDDQGRLTVDLVPHGTWVLVFDNDLGQWTLTQGDKE